MHPVLKNAIPSRIRATRYKLKRLGPARYAAYRRLERAEARKPPPRAGQPFDIGGSAFLLHESTVPTVLSHWVTYGHGIEELHAFRRLAPGHGSMLDIGAAEGIFSAAFCTLTGGRAWAFEPSPEMFGRLEGLRGVNPDLDIESTNVALGAQAAKRAFRQYTDGQFSGVGAQAGACDTLDVTTVDAFVDAHRCAPDFVKIDVEGMEIDVLRGGEQTFGGPVRTIVLEVHYDMLRAGGQSIEELQGVLEDYGFAVESLEEARIDDLARFARDRPEQQPGYTIVVCRK